MKRVMCFSVLLAAAMALFFGARAAGAAIPSALADWPSDSSQAVLVKAVGPEVFRAEVTAWRRDADGWKPELGPWPAVIGRAGFAEEGLKREGDGRTPSGRFALPYAFGREPVIATSLDYRIATAADIWIDDPDSVNYNQWSTSPGGAKSYEVMLREDGLYDLGAVIGYNMAPVIPGLGSAIFMHIWRSPDTGTAGCVALSRANMALLLLWLDRTHAPQIQLNAGD